MSVPFPFMLACIRERDHASAESFSFLHPANVRGAMSGTLLAARMPEGARKHLREWLPNVTATDYLKPVLTHGYLEASALNPEPSVPATDDEPFNVYYLIRHRLKHWGN